MSDQKQLSTERGQNEIVGKFTEHDRKILDGTCDHRLEQGLAGACGGCYEQRGAYITKMEAKNKLLRKQNQIATDALFGICQSDWGIGHSLAKPAHRAIKEMAALNGGDDDS